MLFATALHIERTCANKSYVSINISSSLFAQMLRIERQSDMILVLLGGF